MAPRGSWGRGLAGAISGSLGTVPCDPLCGRGILGVDGVRVGREGQVVKGSQEGGRLFMLGF